MRQTTELDFNLSETLCHTFSRSQDERHAGPAPCIDFGFNGRESLCVTRPSVCFLCVTGQRLSVSGSVGVLAPNGFCEDVRITNWLERTHHLNLLVADSIRPQLRR